MTGYLAPTTLYYGTLGKGKAKPLKHMPAFFDAKDLDVHQYFVASKDGTRVPYFVVAPKDLKLDGSQSDAALRLRRFRSFAKCRTTAAAVGRAWLERGGVYVVANIRGGGEYGPRWHQAALRENRLRAYEDFAAVAEDLVKRGITSRAHLGALGGSNGGLLMGNMLTQYPELFGAIVCEVPLLDMKRYTHLSAGASWIAEYGDPDKPDDWAFIKTFSPYQNVAKGKDYPPILFYTSTRDDRVGPVQARKMAARMLEMGYTNAWFYENIEGGHGGAADNKQAAYMHAMAYTFLWDHLERHATMKTSAHAARARAFDRGVRRSAEDRRRRARAGEENAPPVLLDFGAPWCYSCYFMMTHVLNGAGMESARGAHGRHRNRRRFAGRRGVDEEAAGQGAAGVHRAQRERRRARPHPRPSSRATKFYPADRQDSRRQPHAGSS